MKIEKRSEDSYRVRKMYKGQMYTVTFDHKPTQKEAMQAMAQEFDKIQVKHRSMTFKTAGEEYYRGQEKRPFPYHDQRVQ